MRTSDHQLKGHPAEKMKALGAEQAFVMPLSPRFSVMCYDGLVYSLDLTNGRVILKREPAVDAYNEIQCIASEDNIYFHRWGNGE